MAERWDCFLPQRHLVHPDTPISIDTLFPGPLLLVAALSLLPLRPHQPTSLPCSSSSAFQPSHLQLPTHSGDGTSILPATRRTPMLQRKNLVRRDGDRGCGEGARTVLHSSVSPQKGTFLTGQGTWLAISSVFPMNHLLPSPHRWAHVAAHQQSL